MLSQRVAAARKKKGLTQEELAELTKLTVRTIQRIESGETTPRLYTLKAIAAALNITFEELQNTQTAQSETVNVAASGGTLYQREEMINFLQLFCLSCFSYLILPFLHFLIPLYILKKRKEQNPNVLAFCRSVISAQIYWVIALNLLLFLALAYNTFCSVYLNSSHTINYLVLFFTVYGVNALIISIAFLRSKRIEIFAPIPSM